MFILFNLNRIKLLPPTKHPEKMKALAGCVCHNVRQYLSQVWSVLGDIFNKEPQEGSAHMAASQQNGRRDLFLPVSESRSSVRTGLEVKEIFRFMEGFAFPSFPSNSLRSSFGVLVYGDNLSLLCGNEEKENSQISLHQTDQNMHLRGVRIMTKGNICASERTQQSTLY